MSAFRIILLFLFSIRVMANPSWYVGATVGASFSHLGTHTPEISYASGGLVMDDYPLSQTSSLSILPSLNGGYVGYKQGSEWMLGLGIYNAPQYRYHGHLVEDPVADERVALYAYDYHVISTRLMAEAMWTVAMRSWLPFVNIGVGPAWNQMQAYHEKAITVDGYVPLPPFQKQTRTELAYQAGLGIGHGAHILSQAASERLLVGYRYANLGNTAFGTRGASYPFALHTGRLETNDVYLGYTYLF